MSSPAALCVAELLQSLEPVGNATLSVAPSVGVILGHDVLLRDLSCLAGRRGACSVSPCCHQPAGSEFSKRIGVARPTVESKNLNSSFYFNSSFNQSRVLEHLQRRAHHHDQLAVRADGGLGLRTLALEGGD